ncbi:protein of unknown function DUF4815 [Lysinibacillus phage vB_LfM_LysYB1]|nr:protein of unknown function DUF4815 [Lysinibacillus phage vB_LfM_LysYB1]WAB25239.1 protein of unknown function DUF4815 [Lysinibacillus phage vB_LfM_LysYB2]
MVNKNAYPYNDDFDASKNYSHILAVPGRGAQAREFTQIQTVLKDYMARLSDAILREGNVVSGMGFAVKEGKITVDSGKVYLKGLIHNFYKQTIDINAVGECTVGVKLEESIITEVEDPSLRDPATGMTNYQKEGAHRIKSVPVLTVNDESAPVLYRFMDGELQTDPMKPQLDVVSDLLARRTYDESGNYKVSGLTLFTEPYDDNFISVNVESGKAYIMGYEVIKPTSVKTKVRIANDVRTIMNEPRTYTTASNKYPLSNRHVKRILDVVSPVDVIEEQVSRGNVPGTKDYLKHNTAVSVSRVVVKDGNGTVLVTYTEGKDYQLVDNQAIDWSLNFGDSKEPNGGITYYVNYVYNKQMVPGVDYKLVKAENVGEYDQIEFLPGGDKPTTNGQYRVDYEFYLSRRDLISMDKNGNIIVTEGQPDLERSVMAPDLTDISTLRLGTVNLIPNSNQATVNSASITRLSMEDLQYMVSRLEDLEWNQAVNELDKEAMEGEPATELKGVFSDGFTSPTKADFSHPDFNIAYSFEEGHIMLPLGNAKTDQPTIIAGSNLKWGRIVTAPMREVVEIEQLYATQSMLVNPYNVFNKLATLKLVPEVDNWIDTQTITIEGANGPAQSYVVSQWWFQGGSPQTADDWFVHNNVSVDASRRSGTITTRSQGRTILDEAILYMRQREVEVVISNTMPNTDNLECTFDGQLVALTPIKGTVAGTNPGTVRSNKDGFAYAKFTVPSGVRTGTREVVVRNNFTTATAPYTATGRKRVVEEIVTRTRVTVTPYDPLAQSFIFDDNRVLTSVGLYFKDLDPTNNATVQVRNMVNGYPGQSIIAEKVLTPAMILGSTNASAETKVTFDDPVVCQGGEQYCVVILTDSDKYSMYVAELGKQDIQTKEYVVKQPYLAGTLFSSANALTWTSHQTMDLKFKLYTARFEEQGVIEFSDVKFEVNEIDKFIMMSDFLTPQKTGCTWEAKVDDGTWLPISTYQEKDLTNRATTVKLRATFAAHKFMSPLLATDSFLLVGMSTSMNGTYISRSIELSQVYKKVKQVIDAYVPSGCSVTPMFTHDGTTWIKGTQISSEQVDSDFTRFVYEYDIPAGVNPKQFKAKIDMTATFSWLRPRARRFMNIIK